MAGGYWISVSNPRGRAILAVSLLETVDTDVDSLGVALTQVLADLDQAFPEGREGMGTLFNGPVASATSTRTTPMRCWRRWEAQAT